MCPFSMRLLTALLLFPMYFSHRPPFKVYQNRQLQRDVHIL